MYTGNFSFPLEKDTFYFRLDLSVAEVTYFSIFFIVRIIIPIHFIGIC